MGAPASRGDRPGGAWAAPLEGCLHAACARAIAASPRPCETCQGAPRPRHGPCGGADAALQLQGYSGHVCGVCHTQHVPHPTWGRTHCAPDLACGRTGPVRMCSVSAIGHIAVLMPSGRRVLQKCWMPRRAQCQPRRHSCQPGWHICACASLHSQSSHSLPSALLLVCCAKHVCKCLLPDAVFLRLMPRQQDIIGDRHGQLKHAASGEPMLPAVTMPPVPRADASAIAAAAAAAAAGGRLHAGTRGLTAPCALVLGRFKDVPGRATAAVALSSMSKSATPCRTGGDLSNICQLP